ncbi:ATP-binding protein [Paenisporosarcina cavernae]|uniref:ATP-binding protein n=1 Tax=Paenisporosarcina cavernae TaxID=2320858 RepID=UPI0013C4D2FE|nr:ATP-binding protein [Paenisporosarcina cavernae]
MEKIDSTVSKKLQELKTNLVFHSETCDKHEIRAHGNVVSNPVQMMVIDGQVVCPRCELENESLKVANALKQEHEERLKNIFTSRSVVTDETLLKASFATYTRNLVEDSEEKLNKSLAEKYAQDYLDGKIFNLIFQGKQGTGKSHLSYSILREVNEKSKGTSCVFVEWAVVIQSIRDSYKYRDQQDDESYYIDLLSKVDLLVIDDLGSETGATDTEKTATDFVHRVLKLVGTARQSKSTIVTTNLSGEQLVKMYDSKTISRLLKNPEYIMFTNAPDKRIAKDKGVTS